MWQKFQKCKYFLGSPELEICACNTKYDKIIKNKETSFLFRLTCLHFRTGWNFLSVKINVRESNCDTQQIWQVVVVCVLT